MSLEERLATMLAERDALEKNYCELFEVPVDGRSNDGDAMLLQEALRGKDNEIRMLEERLAVSSKNVERLNDELLGANLEANVLGQKLQDLQQEHDKLLERWMQRVRVEVDEMNAQLE